MYTTLHKQCNSSVCLHVFLSTYVWVCKQYMTFPISFRFECMCACVQQHCFDFSVFRHCCYYYCTCACLLYSFAYLSQFLFLLLPCSQSVMVIKDSSFLIRIFYFGLLFYFTVFTFFFLFSFCSSLSFSFEYNVVNGVVVVEYVYPYVCYTHYGFFFGIVYLFVYMCRCLHVWMLTLTCVLPAPKQYQKRKIFLCQSGSL